MPVEQNTKISERKSFQFSSGRRGFFSEYGEGSGGGEKNETETGSESESDNKDDSSSDTKEDFDVDGEYDLDGSLDLSEADKYDFDSSLDFSEMEKTDEENELEPTGESNNSQETDESGDTNNNSDSPSDSSERGNESLSFDSSGAVLVSEIGKVEGENIQTGDQDHEGNDQDELERAIENELDKYFEEEAEFIKAYHEMVGKERALDEVREREGESRQMTDEEWEKEVEIAANNAKLIYESMEETGIKIPENKEDLEIEKEVEQSEEISEPQLSDLKEEVIEELVEKQYEETELLKEQEGKEVLDAQAGKLKEDVREQKQELEPICEEKEPLEQHQVEPYIKEALETEQENVIKEKELEQYQELELEEQFKTINFNEYVEELVEKQEEETEQLKEQEEKEALEAQASKIKEANSELYEVLEVERDKLDQHEVEATIEEELEPIPEPIIDEKEVEKLQELDIEKQFQTVHLNEYVDELVERQDEDKNIENDKIKQEKENIEQTQEVIHQSTNLQERLEEQEQELELDYEEKDKVEQHQVEGAIEEELKTEPKPIVNEEELEYIKSLEPEKQLEAEVFYEFIEELANKQNEEKEEREENKEQEEISTEQKVAQIMRELKIGQEVNSDENEVEFNSQKGELKHETTSSDEEVVEQLEIEKNKDHQQELEEILEQNRKFEQEALNEIEKEEEDSDKTIEKNYERVKRLYKQQTGKRPIYANKETKGFKQWLEQKKKSEEKEKTKQKKELKEEQKKEEDWKTTLKQWIKEASEEEYNAEFKSELKKALESYDEFEDLTREYLELYDKSQHKKLSEKEKNRLKSLLGRLQELDPIQFELLKSIFFIKKHIAEQYCDDFWNWPLVNRVLSKFYKHISQKYKNLKQAQKKRENCEEILKNWIEQVSEEEISLELKEKLKEIVENYNELEKLAIRFMELYKKEQLGQISQSENSELKSLVKTLESLDPVKIVLLAIIRTIKRYLNDQNFDDFSGKTRMNQILNRFFTHRAHSLGQIKQLSLTQIQEELKRFNWKSITENWSMKINGNKEITVNPTENPSKQNPLYKHKQWLKTVYNHKIWNLDDNKLKTISGVSISTIGRWRKKFNIPTKQKSFNDGKQEESALSKPRDLVNHYFIEYGKCSFNRKLTKVRHNFILKNNYTLLCPDCKKVLKNNEFSESVIIMRNNDLKKLENSKSFGDITIYRVYYTRTLSNGKNEWLPFPGIGYEGQTIETSKERIYNGHIKNAFDVKKKHTYFENSIKRNFIIKDIARKYIRIKILQIIRFQGDINVIWNIDNPILKRKKLEEAINSTQKLADNAEKFWIGYYKTQYKEFGRNIEVGGKENRMVLIDAVKLDEEIRNIKHIRRNRSPFEKLRKELNTTRRVLINNLLFYYGKSLKDITHNMLLKDTQELFELGYVVKDIAKKLRLEGEVENASKTVSDWIRNEIYNERFPEKPNYRRIRDKILSEIIEKKVKEGCVTLKSLMDALPGFEVPGETIREKSWELKRFVINNLGGIKKLNKKYSKPKKDYLADAISIIKDYYKTKKRLSAVKLAFELGFCKDFGYTEENLRKNASSRYIPKHTGKTMKELIEIALTSRL